VWLRQAMRVRTRSVPLSLVVIVLIAGAAFVALTVIVTTNAFLAFDSRAFAIAADLRAPGLTTAARVVTTLGLIAIVGPALLLGAGLLMARRHRPRVVALVSGGALAWAAVWIAKSLVDRPRPVRPLVHTAGQSYPSAHAANSVGWVALAIAVSVVIPARGARVAVIAAGALVAVLVGLSRIYLRAHFASDVLAGYALSVAMYALAAIAVIASRGRRGSASSPAVAASGPTAVP
jgi:membrane-associated phospholipid phosphatase